MRIAYCPYCGAEITPWAEGPNDYLWMPCRTKPCQGRNITLISDRQGFIIEPFELRNRYLFSRPKLNGRAS